MMETAKATTDMKRLFDKDNRTNTLLGIASWVCLALGVILLSMGVWKHFHNAGGPFTATYRDGTVYVEASYGKEAKIPNNAELRASLVTPENDPDTYIQKMAAAMTAMGRDGEAAPTNAIYHVGFYVGDREVEPAAPVNVVVQVLQDGFSVGQPIKVIHLGENDTRVIADTSVDDAGFISFTTDGFSDFAFIFHTGDDQDDDQSGSTSGTGSNGIVGSGRSWTGNAMQGGGMEGPSFDGMTIGNGIPINLNNLNEGEVGLTFQYKDESGTWQNVPEGKNILDYYNSNISITFKFNKQFSQSELQNAGGTLTYQLPPYLTEFGADQNGKLYDQNGEEAGTVTVGPDGEVTIQLNDTFLQNNNSASDLHFTLSGKVDLDKATEKEVGDKSYPGFELVIPTDERAAHSQYGTLQLQKKCKSTAPQRDETTGEWYMDYELTVTAPDYDMPAVRVEDVFDLTSDNAGVQTRLNGLIDSYVQYSVGNDDSMSNTVGSASSTEKDSVYQTNEDGVPQLNWYLGDMTKGESRTLHYRVKLNQDKMETTDFTKDGTLLPNTAQAFSQDYPKANDDADLSIKTHVNVSKVAQENPGYQDSDPKVYFVPDGNGGGYIEYKVTVKNDKEYPVNVKVYDSVNEPHANTSNNNNPNKGKGLSYEQNSFEFVDSTGKPLDPQPKVDFSVKGENDEKYTSFTAHIGWLDPQEQVTFTYRIHVDAETLAAGTVDVNNGVLALFEGQEPADQSYPTWLERYQQNHTVEQESWAAKNFGGAVEPGKVTIPAGDKVYDATGESVTEMDSPDSSFTLGENSFKYTVTVNGNTVWNVSSAMMNDQLGSGLQYSGYVQVVAKDKDGQVKGTVWVKVDGLKAFSFTGQEIGFTGEGYGAGTSYELTYYTTVASDNENFHIVLGNNFSLTGEVIGPDGKTINVSVQDSTSNTAETSNHLKVTKDAWYYEPDTATNLGAFYWVVKVDASYIPNGFALKDVAGEKHELQSNSLLGVYTGLEYDFSKATDWTTFQTSAIANGFKEFSQYSSQFEEGKGLTVTFNSDYTPNKDEYVYLFFKTYVTERQADPYENQVYSNGDNIPGTNVDYFEDDATNYLPDVGGVEKAGMQVFDWDGSTITLLGETKNPADYNLDSSILSGGSVPAGRYAAWSVSVNKTGSMEGDYTITDQIPEGMELSFVAIAKTMHILQPNTNNTPPWAIPLSGMGEGESGLLVGHAKTNQNAYTTGGSYHNNWDKSAEWKPWTAENWKYYPSTDRTVSWGVHIEHSMCISNQTNKPISAYEVDYLVVCRVTDPDVLLGVTKGDPQKTFNNHVTVTNDKGQPVANADAQLTVPCKPVVTKDGVQDVEDGHLQQTIKFTLKVNEEATVVEGEGKTLTLKDKMSENLLLVTDSVKFYSDSACTQELTKETDGVDFTSVGNIITFTIPNGKAVYIQYECLINAPSGVADGTEGTPVENTVYFEGREPEDQGETWKNTVHYDPSGGISGSKTMRITKKDALTGEYLSGAEFEVTLLGTTDETGAFVKSEGVPEKLTLSTDADGISHTFIPTEGGLYQIVETKAPAGYVPDGSPRYYWVGKGTFAPPSAESAGLSSGTKINPMYTGVIDVEITNERAKITVAKEFINADGNELAEGVKGTYTFGLFKKNDDTDTYQKAETAYGPWEQTLTYPDDIGKVLTFYVPYNADNPVQYYILELDKDDKPMEKGSKAWVQTAPGEEQFEFEPSYEYDVGGTAKDAASSDVPETKVTVTNTCYAAYLLPESGGPGTLFYLLTGFVLVAGSAVMLAAKRRRKAQ